MRSAALIIASATNVSSPFLQASPYRRALIISPSVSTALTFATSPIAAIGQGLRLSSGGVLITLRIEDIGDILYESWHVLSDAAGPVQFGVIDVQDVGM